MKRGHQGALTNRFSRWEESPIPDSSTEISPVNTDSRRADPGDLQAKEFQAPIVNLQNAPAAPDPTRVGASLQLLGASNLFGDITGLEGTQRNALEAFKGALTGPSRAQCRNSSRRPVSMEGSRMRATSFSP